MKYDVIIPALNEEKTIARIVAAFYVTGNVNKVIVVVDSETTDNTETKADEAGAIVLTPHAIHGKGELIQHALVVSYTEWVILSDGDYTRFNAHAAYLVAPHNPRNHSMRICIPKIPTRVEWADSGFPYPFDSVAWSWNSGLRSFPRQLLDGIELHGYLTETQINKAARKHNYLIDLILANEVKAPLRFTQRRMDAMEIDRQWGQENGVFDNG